MCTLPGPRPDASPVVIHAGIPWFADALSLVGPEHPARRAAAEACPAVWGEPVEPIPAKPPTEIERLRADVADLSEALELVIDQLASIRNARAA